VVEKIAIPSSNTTKPNAFRSFPKAIRAVRKTRRDKDPLDRRLARLAVRDNAHGERHEPAEDGPDEEPETILRLHRNADLVENAIHRTGLHHTHLFALTRDSCYVAASGSEPL
jgi:hypothetical protein